MREKAETQFWLVAMLAVGLWGCYSGVTKIYEAYQHQGPGLANVYPEGARVDPRHGDAPDPIGVKWVSEERYKRSEYVDGGIMVMVGGLALYGVCACRTDQKKRSSRKQLVV